MAKIKEVLVSGSLDNLTFYTINGRTRVRKKITRVKQTQATKESAKLFGKASKMSAVLRRGLHNDFNPKDKEVMYKINNAMFNWLDDQGTTDLPLIIDPRFIAGLDFNKKTMLRGRIRVALSVDWNTPGKVFLVIPPFVPKRDISAPATTRMVYWTITVTGCATENNIYNPGSFTETLEIPYNDTPWAAQQIEFPYSIMPGSINIVALSMKCETTRYGQPVEVKDKKWLPAGVVGSCLVTRRFLGQEST